MGTEPVSGSIQRERIKAAWAGRVSGCLLGKPLEVLSFQGGRSGVQRYLSQAGAEPLRGYVPFVECTSAHRLARDCCEGHFERAAPDDDINYTVLALLLLEQSGVDFSVADVARGWLNRLPAGATWTAERAAYQTLLTNMDDEFVNGADPGFDLAECADNPCNEWIGAQIRADLYGWVCPGRPRLAARLASRDASLSHRGEGVYGAAFIAALGAALAVSNDLDAALDLALAQVPTESEVAAAVRFGLDLAGQTDAVTRLHQRYGHLSPVHTLNNLALVVWALATFSDDFSAAIGEVVSAGWDTDCNGATVGGLCGMAGTTIPDQWTRPWNGRIGVSLAGMDELSLDDVVQRTLDVASAIAERDDHALH